MITVLKDLNENDNPCATDSWRAAAFHVPNPAGTAKESWAVAWGCCYAQLSSGIKPLGWSKERNTDEDGVEWFDSEEEALAYLASVEEAAL